MGCSSSLISNQQIQTSKDNSQNIIPHNSNMDQKVLNLIQQILSAIASGDTTKQKSTIFELTTNQLPYAQESDNVIQIFQKLLDLLANNCFTNMFLQKEVAHIAQLFLHQVYKQSKNSQIISSTIKQQWLDQVQLRRNNNPQDQISSLDLEFELDCIEAGIKILDQKTQNIPHKVFEYAICVGKTIKQTSNNLSSLLDMSKQLLNDLIQVSSKSTEPWYLTVITMYYSQYVIKKQPECINVVLEIFNKQQDWHVLYAGLDIISSHLQEKQLKVDQIIKIVTELSKYKNGKDSWKIRNKVVQLCIYNQDSTFSGLPLVQIYLYFVTHETNKNVIRTMQNKEYILNQKSQLQKCWEQCKENEEENINEQNQQLIAIYKDLQNLQISMEQKQNKLEMVNQIKLQNQFMQSFFKSADIQSDSLDKIHSTMQQCENILQEIQIQLNTIQSAVCGRNINQIIQLIFDYQVQETKEMQNQLNLYIPENGVSNNEDFEIVQNILDVDSEVQKHLQNENVKTVLIQGGAGTGKTIYCKHLLQKTLEQKQLVPVYINLPQLLNFEKFMVEETLNLIGLQTNEIQQLQMSKTQILFIVDGFDEVRSYKCLYTTNNLLNWNCKVIFTCRTSHIAGNSNYYKYFISSTFDKIISFREIILVHFDDNQINDYLKRIQKQLNTEQSWEWYKHQIDNIPGLKSLIQNPFILSMMVVVIPQLNNKFVQNLQKLDLYEIFVQQWYEREEERMYTNNVNCDIFNLLQEYEEYSQNLATKMMDSMKTVIVYDKNAEKQWKEYFDPNNPRLTTIRRGAPINSSSKQYSFIHKSIQEYLVVKNGKKQVELIIYQKSLECSFNCVLIQDQGVFEFYIQTIKKYPQFRQQLYDIINMSKTNCNISIAAANAITILNVANESFRNMNLCRVKIPGANLSLAMMEGADFTEADLSNVDFQSAWLENAIFNKSNMKNVLLNQSLLIKTHHQIQNIVCDCYNKYVACSIFEIKKWMNYVKIFNLDSLQEEAILIVSVFFQNIDIHFDMILNILI
ncbi:Pentapeptide_repeats-containing protein [Hexamita inflata]|uniref:Pentapeptide repeats-containing protein n=1 Tax=Hexamita inflata TaxID=28002 RepID=A0AA86R316_9EUKA|nr:Pentapeptide repeats-containing protein [Hexamita inflata]